VAEQNRTAVTLRAIAAWLESHPDAVADSVTLDPFLGSTVRDYGVTDAADLAARARRIGGRWTKQANDAVALFKLTTPASSTSRTAASSPSPPPNTAATG
jgi:hypothetical protein